MEIIFEITTIPFRTNQNRMLDIKEGFPPVSDDMSGTVCSCVGHTGWNLKLLISIIKIICKSVLNSCENVC